MCKTLLIIYKIINFDLYTDKNREFLGEFIIF